MTTSSRLVDRGNRERRMNGRSQVSGVTCGSLTLVWAFIVVGIAHDFRIGLTPPVGWDDISPIWSFRHHVNLVLILLGVLANSLKADRAIIASQQEFFDAIGGALSLKVSHFFEVE